MLTASGRRIGAMRTIEDESNNYVRWWDRCDCGFCEAVREEEDLIANGENDG